jgi:hypothetical protein
MRIPARKDDLNPKTGTETETESGTDEMDQSKRGLQGRSG